MSATMSGAATLIYDGECPFCSAYVRMYRVRDAAGGLELVDARTAPEWRARLHALGYDLDAGMVLAMGDRFYHGPDALHALALMGSPSGLFNRINAVLFRSARLSKFAYPALRAGRNAALRLLGRGRIGAMDA